jgi:hypothetical protein
MVHLPPRQPDASPPGPAIESMRRGLWLALLTGATIAFSLVLACATPFAALATLAARNMTRRDAWLLTLAAWLANQAIGFGLLHYPHDAATFGWGIAIGIAGLLATTAAMATSRRALRASPLTGALVAFIAAFVTYELALWVAGAFLPSSVGAFSPRVVLYILTVNATALAGLVLLSWLAPLTGLPRSDWRGVIPAGATQ